MKKKLVFDTLNETHLIWPQFEILFFEGKIHIFFFRKTKAMNHIFDLYFSQQRETI